MAEETRIYNGGKTVSSISGGFSYDLDDKNLPEMQEIWVQSLGQEDPLETGMATHSSILAWRIS